METLIWIGSAVFVIVAIAGAGRAMYLNRQFQRHLKEHHYEHWQRIYQEQLMKKALLWPFMRDTPVDFVWKSKETFGDPRITDLRLPVMLPPGLARLATRPVSTGSPTATMTRGID